MILVHLAFAFLGLAIGSHIFDKGWQWIVAGAFSFAVSLILFTLELYVMIIIYFLALVFIGWKVGRWHR